jgi:hypothetical protein
MLKETSKMRQRQEKEKAKAATNDSDSNNIETIKEDSNELKDPAPASDDYTDSKMVQS